MNRSFSHTELEELLGAYALDAVDPAERASIEAHLPDCPRCRAEVSAHREAAGFLAHVGGDAPAGLWDRIAGALDDPGALETAPVIAFESRRPRPRWRTRTGRLVAMGAAAAVAAIVGLSLSVVQANNRADRLQAALRGDGLRAAALTALADPGATKVSLRSPDQQRAAQVALLPDGSAYLVPERLPTLPADRSYQLWALEDGSRISAGVLGNVPGVVAFHVGGRVLGFAITEEQAGGVVASNNPPVVIGYIRQA